MSDRAMEALLEFLNAVETGIAAAKRVISQAKGIETWNPTAIKWETAEGSKGPYERSEDVNNLEFKALMKDLEAHNDKLTCDGYFYWRFSKSAVIGRKKRK